jgi:hypothetical protein
VRKYAAGFFDFASRPEIVKARFPVETDVGTLHHPNVRNSGARLGTPAPLRMTQFGAASVGLKSKAKSLRPPDKKRRGDLSYKPWIPDEIRGDGDLRFFPH